jgi:hypothetical protein
VRNGLCVDINIEILIVPLQTSHTQIITFFCEDLKNHDMPALNLITLLNMIASLQLYQQPVLECEV